MVTLSPGITISLSAGSSMAPVTSVDAEVELGTVVVEEGGVVLPSSLEHVHFSREMGVGT